MTDEVYINGFTLGPDGKAHPFSGSISWTQFKAGFQALLQNTANMPPSAKQMLAPQYVGIQKPINDKTVFQLNVIKIEGNTRYQLDGVRQSIDQSGPAPMLQRTYTDGIDDLVYAIEQKMMNAGLPLVGGKRRAHRRKTRKQRKSRRRN